MRNFNLTGKARSLGLLAAGLVAGGVLAGTVTASADETGTPTPNGAVAAECEGGHGGRGGHGGPGGKGDHGTAVTGEAADKVKAAVLAKYADATVRRVTQKEDGSYIAHVSKTDGSRLHVLLDKDFAITGEEAGGPGGHGVGRGGGHGRHGGGMGHGPASTDAPTAGATATPSINS